MAIKTLLAVYLVCILLIRHHLVRSAIVSFPRSPCPGVFSYNTSSISNINTQITDRWLGEILVKADTTLSGFWIDVELDKPAHLLGNYLAEVTSSDNREFKIQDLDRRLAKGSITPVKIYVKYDSSSLPPPAVRVIRLNGRQICPPDHEEELDVEPIRPSGYDDSSYSVRPQSSTHKAQNMYEEQSLPNRPQSSSTHKVQNNYDDQSRPQSSSHKNQNTFQNNKGSDEVGTRATLGIHTNYPHQQNNNQSSKKTQNTRGTSYDEVNMSAQHSTSTQANNKNIQNNYQNSDATRGAVNHHQSSQTSHGNSQKIGTSQSSYDETSTRGTTKFNKPQQTHHQGTSTLKGSNQQSFVANRPSNNAYEEVGIRTGDLLPYMGMEKSTSAPLPRTLSTMSVSNHNSRTTQTTRQESGHRVTQPTRPTPPDRGSDRNSQESAYEDSRNTNRDRSPSNSWNKDTIDRGTQTTSSQYDDDFSNTRGSQTHRGGNRQPEPAYGGSRGDVYSSGSNRDRTPSRDQYDTYERERVGIRGSETEYHNTKFKDRDRNSGFRGDPDRNSDFDIESPHRGTSGQDTRGSNRDWEDGSSSHRGSQSHRGSGGNNYDRDETTVYTSLDSHIQRPVYTTTERYQGYPITPHPSSQNRPGHTPLSNSNIRPSEPSSSDYYEWGVRRTSSKRTQLPAPQPNTDRQPEQCGKIAVQPVALISRGTPTKTGDYPWHAAIYRPEGIDLRYICGATLVSLSTLVTAAHCVTRQSTGRAVKPDSLVVYLGKHSLRRWTGNEQTATVSEVIVHPAYNHTAFQADLALLKLSTPVTYNDYVRPVCLWDKRRKSIESVVARRGTVVGWGYDEYQVVTDELMQAHMPVVPKLDCIHSYPTFFSRFVTDLTYCAGFRNGTTACNGDSGGGMVFLEESLDPEDGTDGVWRLRGVVSIGVSITEKFVCDYNHYIVFTDVAQFLPWLENNM